MDKVKKIVFYKAGRSAGFLLLMLMCSVSAFAQRDKGAMISGRIVSTEKEVVDFATVHLKGTGFGSATNREGLYHIKAPAGEYTLVVSAMGYKKVEKKVVLKRGERIKMNFTITPDVKELGEVVISTSTVNRINKSAFNAVAIDATKLHNSTQDLASALTKVPGVKLRESGGVGSDMNLSLDGMSGKNIKLFIDGVPQDGVGRSFGLNNIPINFAERIEVYRGVVPVGFGTDALGGVINIVTGNKQRTFVDASYSYGSFNTHKSYVNVGHTARNGFTFEINAFQNYSDNSYHIDTPVEHFDQAADEDGWVSGWDSEKLERVKRFHDTYHNEAVVGKVGLVGKSFADRLMLTFTYSQNDKEIQNGVVQEVVYGQKRRKGHSIMPSLEYRKRNLFTKGLDVNLTANYNRNITQNIDTATCEYNWLGQTRYVKGKLGEQSYQNYKSSTDNWNGTFTANYHLAENHAFVLNNVLMGYERKPTASSNITDATGAAQYSKIKKKSRKNITGLSYRYSHKDVWNVSVFGKYYNQYSSGPRNTANDGTSSSNRVTYEESSTNMGSFGYGVAATYLFPEGFQAKFSYEKALRLPTADELFGDDDMELGDAGLEAEHSQNVNVSLSYTREFGKHSVYVEGGFVYRDTKDFIRRLTGTFLSGSSQYAAYMNHGRVKTVGVNAEVRYNYSKWFSVGGNFTDLNTRDYEKYGLNGSESTTYKVRMPNIPYLFSNADASFYWHDLFGKGNLLTMTYSNYYVHAFPLHWENHGVTNKKGVPDQFSHNLSLVYSLKNSRYNFSFECKNFTDEKLYDNFSLQKAGRAFYGKVRYYFNR